MSHLEPTSKSTKTNIRKARLSDIPAIKAMVNAAYSKYVERIGKPPAPMTTDYEQLLSARDIFVIEPEPEPCSETHILGSIILAIDPNQDSIGINNLVVDPAAQGLGYGRLLMEFAEDTARQNGTHAITLFTNEKMYENLALYGKLGFEEVGRRTEDGYDRVYFRKELLGS